jgi:hypothetical protein
MKLFFSFFKIAVITIFQAVFWGLFFLGNINISDAAESKLQCLPPVQSVKINEPVTIKVSGGSGVYQWSVKEGNPSSGSGAEFTTSFNSLGRKNILVKGGGKVTCVVNVFDANYNYSCNDNGTCSIKIIQPFKLGPYTGKSPVRPIDLDFTVTIKDSFNLVQDGRILTDGSLISSKKPILLADALPRTTEPGGPSGGTGPAGPIGKEEPAGPIGVTEPGGPSGEWNETGGVYDTPPVDFSDKCGSQDFIPTLYAAKKERGFVLKMGVCAKPGDLVIEGFKCSKSGNRFICNPPSTNQLTSQVKIERTYNIQVKLIAEKGNKNKSSEVLNFSTPLIPVKISAQKKIAINSSPVPKISSKQNDLKDGYILSADASFDPDRRPKPLSYNWSVIEKPPGSNAIVNNPYSKIAVLKPDIKGKYKVKLTASDGLDDISSIILLDAGGASIIQPTTSLPVSNDKLSVLCNFGKICKTTLTQNGSAQINYNISSGSEDNTIISFYNIPQGITLTSKPSFLKPGQKSGQIIVSASNSTLPGKYTSIVRFRQGSKFIELPIEIEVINTRFPPLPPTVEILPKF